MPDKLITDCVRDPDRLEPLLPCMPPWGDDREDFEWNVISKRTTVLSCGAIVLDDARIRHVHDAEELALCRTHSAEIAALMRTADIGMGSAGSASFDAFFIVADKAQEKVTEISEAVIRRTFGGTINPQAKIWAESLEERGKWWTAVAAYAAGYGDPLLTSEEIEGGLKQWRDMMAWFHSKREFVASAFVMIGDRPKYPDTRAYGCVFPRLALGLTSGGSLVGICSHVVHT